MDLVAWGVHEAHRSLELGVGTAFGAFRGHAVALGLLAVRALVHGGVRVPQLYCDAPFQLLAVAGRPDPRERLYQGGLAVVDVAYRSDVDLRLTR